MTMNNRKRWTALAVALTALAAFSACGKQTENLPTEPEETTEAVTTVSETAPEETTEPDTEETLYTRPTHASEETAEPATAETTAAGTTATAAATAAATTAATAAPTTAAPAATTAAPATTAPPAATTPAPTTPAPTEAPTEAPTPAAADSELTFKYGENTLNVGDSAVAFTAAAPCLNSESAPSCYGNGENINYYYEDFTVYVWNDNDSYMVYSIDITGPGASTSRGITVGSAADAVIAAYGSDYEEQGSDFVYRYGDEYELRFSVMDGVVNLISYNKDM